VGSWPQRIKEFQIKSFANWRSEALRFAAKDHKLLTTPMTSSQGRSFVAIDMIFFQLNNSGIARVWESLIREWSKTDLGSRLIILDRAKSSPRIDGVRYIDIPGYNYDQKEADAQMLEKICQENQASVFLSTYYTKPLFTPTLLMIHDMIPERLGFDLNHPAWQLKHEAIKSADKIVCVSQNTATDLANYCSVDISRISVAHNGVDLNFKPATTDEINSIRTKYGITKPYFLFVGERAGYKNAGLLFSSFRGLPNSDMYQIVCLGGSREMETEYLPLIEGLDILMFRVDNSEMHSIYSGALALVYPSMYEGFGLPVIEAMACGCPVITCRSGSIPEISGDDVIYTEPTNVVETSAAMVSVMNKELRETMIKAGLSRASLFSWAKMAQKLGALIEEMISPMDSIIKRPKQ
jgi:glycosyltransferase involved in cell wall biosynthesis